MTVWKIKQCVFYQSVMCYSKQSCYVKWQNAVSREFSMSNGTRQGGILSPYLFSRYIRELLVATDSTAVGCFIGNHCFIVLVYADDIVLLVPSWRGLHVSVVSSFKRFKKSFSFVFIY